MSFFISDAFAQVATTTPTTTPTTVSALSDFLMPILLIFAIMYVMLIRPQQKKINAHNALVDALKKGDEVLTSGGILGKIVKVDDVEVKILHVEIAKDVVVRLNRTAIVDVLGKKEKATEAQTPVKKPAKKK
jgi:preprotein translocase subunit YajC